MPDPAFLLNPRAFAQKKLAAARAKLQSGEVIVKSARTKREQVANNSRTTEAKKKLAGNLCVNTGQGSGGGFTACGGAGGGGAGGGGDPLASVKAGLKPGDDGYALPGRTIGSIGAAQAQDKKVWDDAILTSKQKKAAETSPANFDSMADKALARRGSLINQGKSHTDAHIQAWDEVHVQVSKGFTGPESLDKYVPKGTVFTFEGPEEGSGMVYRSGSAWKISTNYHPDIPKNDVATVSSVQAAKAIKSILADHGRNTRFDIRPANRYRLESVRVHLGLNEAKKKIAGNLCVNQGQGSGGGFTACGGGSSVGSNPAAHVGDRGMYGKSKGEFTDAPQGFYGGSGPGRRLDFKAKADQAVEMSSYEIHGALADIAKTLPNSDALDRTDGGNRGGYYRDESSVLRKELELRKEIRQAFEDWSSGKAYVDNGGNYRVRARPGRKFGEAPDNSGPNKAKVASWNKLIKSRFGKDSFEFHNAAKRFKEWQAANIAKMAESVTESKKKIAGNLCVNTGQGSGGGFTACGGSGGGRESVPAMMARFSKEKSEFRARHAAQMAGQPAPSARAPESVPAMMARLSKEKGEFRALAAKQLHGAPAAAPKRQTTKHDYRPLADRVADRIAAKAKAIVGEFKKRARFYRQDVRAGSHARRMVSAAGVYDQTKLDRLNRIESMLKDPAGAARRMGRNPQRGA